MDKSTLLQQANAYNATVSRPKQQKKGGWLSNFISEAGGTAGGLGGAALGASLGSVVPGIGTVIGGLLGGGIGAFGGGTAGSALEQKVQGDDINWGKALGEGALEGVMGAGPLRLGKLALAGKSIRAAGKAGGKEAAQRVAEEAVSKKLGGGLTSKVAGKLEKPINKTTGKMMNSQTNLSKPEMRKLGVNAPELYTQMNKDYGLFDIEDIAKVGRNVTGKSGVQSEGVRNIISNGKGIDTGDLDKTLEDLLTTKGSTLGEGVRKNLRQQLRYTKESMYADQPLNPLGNPLAAFDAANDFRDIARKLDSLLSPQAKDQQLSEIYKGLADSIEKKLYSQEGVTGSITPIASNMARQYKQLAASATTAAEKKAYEKLSQEAIQMRTIKDLRSSQQKWVLADKIERKTQEAAGNASAKFGGGGGIIQRAGNAIVNSQLPRAGAKLANKADELRAVAGVATPPKPPSPLGMLARVGTGSAIASGLQTPEETQASSIAPELTPEILGEGGISQTDMSQMTPSDQTGSITDTAKLNQALQQAALQALAQGDSAGLKDIMSVAQLFQSMQPKEEKPKLNATQARAAAAAQNALNDLPMIEEAIQSGKLGGAKAIPGAGTALGRRILGTEDLDAALFNIADNILRARSGAAAPEAEVKRFVDTFLPGPLDSPEAKKQKLERAARELQGYVNPQEAAAGSIEELMAEGGL